jgi:hypothetical protein
MKNLFILVDIYQKWLNYRMAELDVQLNNKLGEVREQTKKLLFTIAKTIYNGDKLKEITEKLNNEKYLDVIVCKTTTMPRYMEFFSSLNTGETDKAKIEEKVRQMNKVFIELFI